MICETKNRFNLRCLLIFFLLTFGLFFPEKVNSNAVKPEIKGISTLKGPTTGGTLITIKGSGFPSKSWIVIDRGRLRIGILKPPAVKVYDNNGEVTGDNIGTKIEFYTPPVGEAGFVEIRVYNNSRYAQYSESFTFEYSYPPPVIQDISPIGGKIEGDMLIKITGSEFRDEARVRIGEKEVTGVVRDEGKRLNAWMPPGSKIGPQDVTVINPDGSESNTLENGFVYAASPTITKMEPKGGSIGGGTRITITGFNFLSGVEARIGERVKVLIGERKAEIVEINDRKIVVKSLGGMSSQDVGAQDVTVQNIVNPDELFDTRKDVFVYAFSPEIKRVEIPLTGVNPNGGTQIEITGTYFPAQENLQVHIGGKETMVVAIKNAGTRIITTAPSGNDLLVVLLFSNQQKSGEVDVKVSNLINPEELFHILPGAFTYNPRLEASKIEPDSGILDGGMLIAITGSGFIEPISIEIGGKDAQDITWVSSKQITAKTPKSAQFT